jgi:hypothetical protein
MKNDYTRRRFNCVERVHYFGQKPELAPLTPKEVTLFAGVTASWTGLKAHDVAQGTGTRGFREGAAERRLLVGAIWAMNRRIADMAKSIAEEGEEPGIAEKFRLPRGNRTYQMVASTGLGFANEAEPIKALFIERGMEATFVTDLRAMVTEFETAAGVRVGGLAVQITGTAGLAQLAREGLKFARLLRPLINEKLKAQPALQAAWQLASRVAKPGAVEVPVTPPPATPGSGS